MRLVPLSSNNCPVEDQPMHRLDISLLVQVNLKCTQGEGHGRHIRFQVFAIENTEVEEVDVHKVEAEVSLDSEGLVF
jgi:hypothetical protein